MHSHTPDPLQVEVATFQSPKEKLNHEEACLTDRAASPTIKIEDR